MKSTMTKQERMMGGEFPIRVREYLEYVKDGIIKIFSYETEACRDEFIADNNLKRCDNLKKEGTFRIIVE